MTLLCFVIVGKYNEPLYMCDCCSCLDNDDNSSSKNEALRIKDSNKRNEEIKSDDSEEKEDEEEKEDIFGFASLITESTSLGDSLSFQHEFMLHSALDRLEEIIGTYQMPSMRRQTTGSHWLGFLCPVDENSVYAFATSTNIKFLAMVSPIKRDQNGKIATQDDDNNSSSDVNDHIQPLSSSSLILANPPSSSMTLKKGGPEANAVKLFFARIHELYIQYTMNPFTKIQGKISSKNFDSGVKLAIQQYYQPI